MAKFVTPQLINALLEKYSPYITKDEIEYIHQYNLTNMTETQFQLLKVALTDRLLHVRLLMRLEHLTQEEAVEDQAAHLVSKNASRGFEDLATHNIFREESPE